MRTFFLTLLLVLSIGTTTLAQGVDLAGILQLLEELKAQVEQLQQSFNQQTFLFNNIQTQLNDMTEKFDASQETIQRIPIIEEQILPLLDQVGEFENILDQIFAVEQKLAPLLEQWPAVQEAMQTMTAIQTSFNEQVEMMAGLQQIVRELTDPTSTNEQVDALQTQVTALEQQVNDAEVQEAVLQEQINSAQMWNWVALGGVAVLLVLQVVFLMIGSRNKQTSAV